MAGLPGVTARPATPPSLGQGFREVPVNFVIMTSDSYANLSGVAQQFLAEMAKNPGFVNPDTDLRLNKPEILHRGRPRARRRCRHQRRPGGAHGRDHARRAPGHALQARCRAVRRDGADACHRTHHAGRHREALRARARRCDGAAVVAGAHSRVGESARVEPLQPAPLGHASRPTWRPAIRSARRCRRWTRPPTRFCSRAMPPS